MQISKIKGIGPKSIINLKNLNITTVDDLIKHYPYKYNIVSYTSIHNLQDGQTVLLNCNVDGLVLLRRFNSKMNSLSFRAGINGKTVNIIIFNRAFLKDDIILGKNINVIGKYSALKNTIVANDIYFTKVKEGTINSVYHLTTGITQKNIIKYISLALSSIEDIKDYIPNYLNDKYNFISKIDAVNKVHFPQTLKELQDAKDKLIFEEFFIFMFKINYLKEINKEIKLNKIREVKLDKLNEFIKSLPFKLTTDQNTCIKDIYKDLTSTHRMNRMIEGDVGSGKTVVSVAAIYINYLSKSQSALLVPTEVLAMQHYETIKNLFINTPINITLLLGGTKKSEKDKIYEDLLSGRVDLVIGTHALISEKAIFKNLGLVITDEQHRFGVKQRSTLSSKGVYPDTLYMSATPIPRTYALTLYGDMDISYIKTKPLGRKNIETIIKSDKDINEILSLMLDEIKKGHQIYVVSPLIEESETLDLTNVKKLKEKIDSEYNKKVRTEILHGRLSKDDKEKVMENFKKGITNILISTTVVEVGLDCANATMMVIFDAEMFGLATLHQLRGRIGRNSYDCKCILIGPSTNKRLKVLTESNDGFYITEKDFEMRGEGDLFGVKQSGDMSFKIASIKNDYKVLLTAKDEADTFIKENMKNDFIKYKLYSKIALDLRKLD
ncbi:MAG: ATP-dependent DNA helicase RecG [Bacilli bacterium]